MRRPVALCLLAAGFVMLSISTLASAQDFQKSYDVSAGASINIRTASGNITITGSNGSQVVVSGFKEGRDRDLVTVEDSSTGNRIDVRSKYPRAQNVNASVNFEVSVPQAVSLNFDNISTASGNIEVRNVNGNVTVKSASGNVTVESASGRIIATSASGNVNVTDISGSVSARTASGNVVAHMNNVSGNDSLEFSSASGQVEVWVPDSIDADVALSTSSGALTSDFSLQMDDPGSGPGRSAHGRLGNGNRRLTVSTASGSVSLKRQSS